MTEAQGIPFFITEFCTYEHDNSGIWMRRKTFRLANTRPHSPDNPLGWRQKGEVFEEFLSKANRLPSRDKRICTTEMKIEVSSNFLADWFSGRDGIEAQGPDETMITDDDCVKGHRRYGGLKPDDVLLRRRAYCRTCPPKRPAQLWRDYTAADITGRKIDKLPLFMSFVGLRADEGKRLTKMHKCRPAGEHNEARRAPLADNRITKKDVDNFWHRQPWNLGMPSAFGNCTFCYLKSARKLGRIAAMLKEAGELRPGTPLDLAWWSRIETLYGRSPDTEIPAKFKDVDNGVNSVGFFDVHDGVSYETIQAEGGENRKQSHLWDNDDFDELGCDCTD